MTPRPRPCARVLLLDPEDRLLLFQVENSVPNPDPLVWITAGGGVDPGESHEEAAHRELWEEVGVRGLRLSRCVWLRTHVWCMNGEFVESRERFFIARTQTNEVNPAGMEPYEKDVLQQWRWWSAAEIQSSTDTFAPRRLGILLASLLMSPLPEVPINVDK